MAQLDFAIKGMTCGSCAARITHTLEALPNVREVAVNFATNHGRVVGELSPDMVRGALAKIGYEALFSSPAAETPKVRTPAESPANPDNERVYSFSVSSRDIELLAAAVLTLPVFIMSMFMLHFPGDALVQWVLTSILLIWPGRGFFARAARLLVYRSVNMDTLVALGVGAAYLFSIFLWLRGEPHLYFESAAVIVTLILLGKTLEERAKQGALAAIRGLGRLQPKTAHLMHPDGTSTDIPVAHLKVGQVFSVSVGETLPSDGDIVDGESMVDESLVTGESVPVARTVGDSAVGATMNVGPGRLLVKTTKTGQDTMLAQIIALVEDAQATKPKIQRLVDQIASVFVPVVLVLATATFLVWFFLLGRDVVDAIMPAVAVLVVACPCALGLATPTAILVGTGRAARRGILVRSADGLEQAGKIKVLVIDKTGTLTQGKPVVADVKLAAPADYVRVHAVLAALESVSQHPLAKAVVSYALTKVPMQLRVVRSEEIAGRGIGGTVAWQGGELTCLVGSKSFLAEHRVALPPEWMSQSEKVGSSIFLAIDGQAASAVFLADEIRESAAETVRALQALGVQVVMATGDQEAVAQAVAKSVGITQVHAQVSPEAKVAIVKDLRKQHANLSGLVAMVGDGINDAPALAAADIGIALGSGTDIAMGAAALVLPRGDLRRIVDAMTLSRDTMRVIRQNLFWAFIYNLVAVPVAAFGLLSPMIAAAAMALSSVSVVTNSLRLRRAGKELIP